MMLCIDKGHNHFRLLFGLPVLMYRKSYCTVPGIGVGSGVGVNGGVGSNKMLSFMLKFLCDGQGTVRGAILYMDRSCFHLYKSKVLQK